MKNLLKQISDFKNPDFNKELESNLDSDWNQSSNQIGENIDLKITLKNYFLILKEFSCGNEKDALEFILSMINLIIMSYQIKKCAHIISEYYIEKYLKDVLEVLTNKFETVRSLSLLRVSKNIFSQQQ